MSKPETGEKYSSRPAGIRTSKTREGEETKRAPRPRISAGGDVAKAFRFGPKGPKAEGAEGGSRDRKPAGRPFSSGDGRRPSGRPSAAGDGKRFGSKPSFGDRPEGGFKKEGGFKREFGARKDGDFKRDDRPGRDRDFSKGSGFKKEFGPRKDGENREGGFRKEGGYKREGGFRKEGGFKKDFAPRSEGENNDGIRKEGGFKKDGFKPGRDGGDRKVSPAKKRLGQQSPNQARQMYRLPGAPARGETPDYNNVKEPRFANRKGSRKATEESEDSGLVRLNRFIAQSGLCSRREADSLISTGQITVNGKIVDQMGYMVKKDDVVKYGRRLLNREKLVYVLLNKPKDFLTTTEDPDERKTVMTLVENACKERIYPVGRLDRNTTGLLLITNDGELSEKLMHPSHNIRKIYQVDLDKPLTAADEAAVREGVVLEDGKAPVDELEVLSKDRDIVGLSIHIGRNRIVRRIFESLGYKVVRLDRVMYAGLTKKDLPRGNWRFLTEKEVINLKYFT